MKALRITQGDNKEVISANLLNFACGIQGEVIIEGLSPDGDWWQLTRYATHIYTLSDMRGVLLLLAEYHRIYDAISRRYGLTMCQADHLKDWEDNQQ